MVPQAPGGANDVIARAVAQGLESTLGQPVIVENRPGANGNLGTGQVARSAADGYTFLVTAQSAYTINPALYSKVPFDPHQGLHPRDAAGRGAVPAGGEPELSGPESERAGGLCQGPSGQGGIRIGR